MNNRTIKIVCFAGLRKYFGAETSVVVEQEASYATVIDKLIEIKPEAKEVLSNCRIAVNEAFVPMDEELKETDTFYLIPPSSGG